MPAKSNRRSATVYAIRDAIGDYCGFDVREHPAFGSISGVPAFHVPGIGTAVFAQDQGQLTSSQSGD